MKKKLNINTKQTSFKVPEGYFDTLETRLMDTIKKTSPRDMKVDSGFTVPENYFESFKVETETLKVLIEFSFNDTLKVRISNVIENDFS